uniref:Fermentation-respiration switch protein n=1 Tax=Marseillevirus LCMAC202 TaxID=2506606 RepID=A0A481Z0A3_9VIRU|nr:MAG: fermentation-respiration switch protein [Marseillevirus LCMAC202]
MGNSSSVSSFIDDYGQGRSAAPTMSSVFPTHLANPRHSPTKLQIHKGVRYIVAMPDDRSPTRRRADEYVIVDDTATTPLTDNAVLFFHGNCTTVDQSSYNMAQTFATHLKKDVYIFEYPGYGESVNDGPATPQSTSSAGKVIFDMLTTQYGTQNVDIMAHSIGTGVAIRTLVFGATPRKLVLISPLASTTSVVTWDIPLFNAFDNLRLAKNIICPVCVIHGDADEVINMVHAGKLYSNLLDIPKELHIIPGAGHNDIFTTETMNIIRDFLVVYVHR